MTGEDITQYLAAPHIAVMATVGRHGDPQLTPNWYRYDGAVLTFVTRRDRLKYTNIRRHPRMAVCIYDPPAASNYVVIYGTATLEDASTAGPAVWDEIRRIVARYAPPAEVDSYLARWRTEPRVLVTVTPDRIATRSSGRQHTG